MQWVGEIILDQAAPTFVIQGVHHECELLEESDVVLGTEGERKAECDPHAVCACVRVGVHVYRCTYMYVVCAIKCRSLTLPLTQLASELFRH